MGRHLPPDHSRGDANTIGGYMAVHDRPAAFEGSDGRSYSVDIITDETGGSAPFGAYLLFVQWSPDDPSPTGHLETDFLAHGDTADEARAPVAALPLARVRALLEELIRRRAAGTPPERKWWDAMRDEGGEGGEGGDA